MQKVDVAPELTMQRSEATLPSALAGAPTGVGVAAGLQRAMAFVARLSDMQLALFISAVLFAMSAWPLALTQVPPYQDLPNHLATVMVIRHPELYPEFVFNGFFKTNAALFTWLFFVGKVIGDVAAAKVFALIVIALNALVIPRTALELGNRKKLVIASLFAWPMIHNWFVCMGMLDFALGVPLALFVLVLANRQRVGPSLLGGALMAIVAALAWYAHVFPLMVVLMLVGIHVVLRPTWRERLSHAKRLFVPLIPAIALVAWSLYLHVTEPAGAMTGYVSYQKQIPPWELVYNLWAEWFWGFTWLSISSLLPCIALGLLAIFRLRSEKVPFFSVPALCAMIALYLVIPYTVTNWFHVNSRVIPFLWMAALVRVPERMPKPAIFALGLAGALYSAGMGIDFVRLDADRAAFTAGMPVVPERSHLLPLVFKQKHTSENTKSVLHAWGFYATEKRTSVPLLFAHSRSFPVMYRDPPPIQFNHLVLESFAPSMHESAWMCDVLRAGGVVVEDCDGEWRKQWGSFWRMTTPVYDHVLMWDATPEVVALVPNSYKLVFNQDKLRIYERDAKLALGDGFP